MKKMHIWSFIAIRSFLITTTFLAILAGVGCYIMYLQEADSIEKVIKINAKMHNRLLAQKVSLDLRSLFNDIQLVSNHIEVQHFLRKNDSVNRTDLESEFIALCQIRKVYDQVRILDNDGMELVRVNDNNGHPAAVPQEKLQNKSSRYYFKESLNLKLGEVYVSPFDLNVENGKIEQPLKPMIRISMPIYDNSGHRLGIVVLNYLGQQIIDGLVENAADHSNPSMIPMRTMLLNSDGYCLLSPDRTQEWAFMYPDRKEINFGAINPEAWKQIISSPEGQFSSFEGGYTYSTIVVSPEVGQREINGNIHKWKIVCLTQASTINSMVSHALYRYMMVYSGILLIILFGTLTRARFVSARVLGQKKLEIAKQTAEDANLAKSDFLARMSHEIRTPMNAIIGLTYLALKTEMSPKQHDYLTKVSMSAKSLLGIINDILDFSKIEADRLELEKVDFILDDVFNDILNMLGLEAEKKGLELLLMVRSTVPNLLIGDRLRLGQVLLNLAGNAIKFTESGNIIISAKLVEETGDTAQIRFSVQDSGIGITSEQSAKLFQPFCQADGSISRRFGGTGLGLTISKRLVELMSGTMQLKSEIGKGSEFIFTIPFGLQARHTQEHYIYPEEIRGMRVLIVDDSRMLRNVLAKVLQSFTFDVTTAEKGEQALELLRKYDKSEPFKLVITDWRMPDIDGIKLAQKIKETSFLENIPKVILLTAYGHDEIRHRAEQIDLDGFMLKPFNRSILFDTIMEVFANNDYRMKKTISEKFRNGMPANVAGAHILLAEDNDLNQQVAREILEGADVTVSIANNGQEAVEMIKTNTYDAVLMDIQMPIMDGFQAVKNIRSDKNLQSIPIIAMTAHALVGDREKSLLAGMNDHVTKPIDPDVLMEILSKWLPEKPETEPVETHLTLKGEDPPLIFNNLPGINAKEALARVRGNIVLYEKILVNFANDYGEIHSKIHYLISINEYEEARALAHNMKGVSGNIGAATLHQAFSEMEIALSNGSDTVITLLNNLEQERKRVIEGIFKAFPRTEKDKGIIEADTFLLQEVQKLLPRLRIMSDFLKKHDVEARDIYRSIESRLTHAAPKFAKELGALLDKFDFSRGHTRVKEFIAKCEQKEKDDG
ncbi:Signal transduction histidine kinase [Maridesulfovibrio ferrireducens]|uniref:Sensory/regulatory protein RpfC n=1 Tax=Maridesulfovibrio ferrireducens TaxID=246191 RepID=A0A1G9JJD1_9BACT|nr:hybrid sensor histidine kinase/response regulator [Maridesulfovibrio ferrireducens]SDL37598.1 Signal transduction histidine kinase [Maridesulfovibrio ferrireducens]